MAYSVKVEHINPFISATIETFQFMVKTEVKAGSPLLKKHSKLQADISGIIGLSGGAKGSVILCFPRIMALKTVSLFSGTKVLAINGMVVDAIGELANIIAGSAKRDLVQHRVNISLPTVVMGDGHEVEGPTSIIPMAVPFESKLGSFDLIVSFKSEY